MNLKNEKLVQSDWEDLGTLDPMWAVLSEPQKRYGQWNEKDFYATGNTFVQAVLTEAEACTTSLERGSALDFGCGLGRLTFALSEKFSNVTGVDVSTTMLEKADAYRQTNGIKNCKFVHNNEPSLSSFENNSFDFICTYIVLQHIPDKKQIEIYINEFVRILKPGGLLFFQIPTFLPMQNRLQLRRRVYDLFRKLGVPMKFLYTSLGLHPIHYNFLLPAQIQVALGGAKVLKVDKLVCTPSKVISSNYFVTKE